MDNNYKVFLMELQKCNNYFEDLFSNIFTMREIGNKTHGDMAEIALTSYINNFLPSYTAIHVGKDLFRKKTQEEDIVVFTENHVEIPISIKAYGEGPLQLSTDKDFTLFPLLESYNKEIITEKETINTIITQPEFQAISNINILPLIYNENKNICSIMVYDFDKVKNNITKIVKILPGGHRKHPVYKFFNDELYLFEVRYGGPSANALQRGVWTHTKNAKDSFINITNGYINYTTRNNLLQLLSQLMIATNETIDSIEV